MEKIRMPVKGETIYVDNELYVYRGADDFAGGKATVSNIFIDERLPEDNTNRIMVSISEQPRNVRYNWKHILDNQEEWKKKFGDSVAHHDPDYRPEFNDEREGWKQW